MAGPSCQACKGWCNHEVIGIFWEIHVTNLGPRLAPPARSLFCRPSRQAHGITMATRFLCTVEAGPCPKDRRGAQRIHPNDPRPQRQSPAPALRIPFRNHLVGEDPPTGNAKCQLNCFAWGGSQHYQIQHVSQSVAEARVAFLKPRVAGSH